MSSKKLFERDAFLPLNIIKEGWLRERRQPGSYSSQPTPDIYKGYQGNYFEDLKFIGNLLLTAGDLKATETNKVRCAELIQSYYNTKEEIDVGIYGDDSETLRWVLATSKERAHLIIRGAVNFKALFANLFLRKVYKEDLKIYVNKWDTYYLEEIYFPHIIEKLRAAGSKKLRICGHSMGGGHATLFALYLHNLQTKLEEEDPIKQLELENIITFSAPKKVDWFAYLQWPSLPFLRLTVYEDVVPKIPPFIFFESIPPYGHLGQEIELFLEKEDFIVYTKKESEIGSMFQFWKTKNFVKNLLNFEKTHYIESCNKIITRIIQKSQNATNL